MSKTLMWLAGVAVLAGLAALGVGIGAGSTLLTIAAYAVIFLACLLPAAVGWHDSKPRPAATVTPEAAPAAVVQRIPERETGGRVVWIEPQRHRLH